MEVNNREARFRSWLKISMQKQGYFIQNIESITKSGIPDTYACLDGTPMWMELKADEIITAPLIRKYQRIWGIRHDRALGKTLLVQYVEVNNGVYIWKQPIVKVRPVGDKLQVLDQPFAVVDKSNVVSALFSIAKGISI